MSECICESCKNLKGIIGESGEISEYECKCGFPSDQCEDCEALECDAVCSSYECIDEEDMPRTVKCMKCGKELTQVVTDETEGEIYCVQCYLSND